MQDAAIRVEGLSKRYRIGQRQRDSYKVLRDVLAESLSAPFRYLKNGRAGNGVASPEFIWALKDLSLEIKQGEVLGLIGPNGAGKTTFLKILSRITEPTEGCAELRGRVGSLLEGGTGFHPELTGRENIYLNGAILGMQRVAINRKFNEIVGFSEIEKFIDTPVKHYSSGMYMRLAFAVAAHLNPEILLVDEVLAVGDAAFQKKCLGKMEEVAGTGRTVLFVSHNMSAVLHLCSRVVLIREGRVVSTGPPKEVVDLYMSSGMRDGGEKQWPSDVQTKGPFRPIAVRIRQRGAVTETVFSREPFSIEFEYELLETIRNLTVQIGLFTPHGVPLLGSQDRDDPRLDDICLVRRPGRYLNTCQVPADLFNEGRLIVAVNATTRPKVQHYFYDEHALVFTVDATGGVGSRVGKGRAPNDPMETVLRPFLEWKVECLKN